jgi:hypothetical protein
MGMLSAISASRATLFQPVSSIEHPLAWMIRPLRIAGKRSGKMPTLKKGDDHARRPWREGRQRLTNMALPTANRYTGGARVEKE